MTPRTAAIISLVVLLATGTFSSASPTPVPSPSKRSALNVASSPRVQVELISRERGIEPGRSLWVGLRQRIAPGWHTYWINPGDSGEPTAIAWTLPEGFQAADIAWPPPGRIPVGPVMSYGYTGEVILPVSMRVPPGLEPGSRVTLRADATWLVCEKICIPEEARVELTLPVVVGDPPVDPRGAELIDRALSSIPTDSPWPAAVAFAPEAISLHVKAEKLTAARIAGVWFYPRHWGVIDHAAPQTVTVDETGIRLTVARGALSLDPGALVEGVLVIDEGIEGNAVSQAFVVKASSERRDTTTTAGLPSPTLVQAVVLAFVGGLLLNLMPCVLPVLSIKVLSLIRHAGDRPGVVRGHGIAYTAGVLVSFALVAAILMGLRAGGLQIGWGFQLQSPAFVALLAYLLFVLALSLSGVLVIGGRAAGLGQRLAERPGYVGSFFTGALATVAATPCTAPFMGVALGFALTQSPASSLLVFEALALGLALPYLTFTLVPSWGRHVPRPGPWMERLKQCLAFPLYASVAWLVWVVSQQTGPTGVAAVLGGLVLIGFAVWLRESSRDLPAFWCHAGTAAAASGLLAAVALGAMLGTASWWRPASAPTNSGLAWEPFSPGRLAELRARGEPVFVNFTAAWCITCLVNERVALQSPSVVEAFGRRGIVSLKADWTNRDAQIAEVLGSFGRSGVPLYLVYPRRRPGEVSGTAPVVLPQILSERMIIEAINN